MTNKYTTKTEHLEEINNKGKREYGGATMFSVDRKLEPDPIMEPVIVCMNEEKKDEVELLSLGSKFNIIIRREIRRKKTTKIWTYVQIRCTLPTL